MDYGYIKSQAYNWHEQVRKQIKLCCFFTTFQSRSCIIKESSVFLPALMMSRQSPGSLRSDTFERLFPSIHQPCSDPSPSLTADGKIRAFPSPIRNDFWFMSNKSQLLAPPPDRGPENASAGRVKRSPITDGGLIVRREALEGRQHWLWLRARHSTRTM